MGVQQATLLMEEILLPCRERGLHFHVCGHQVLAEGGGGAGVEVRQAAPTSRPSPFKSHTGQLLGLWTRPELLSRGSKQLLLLSGLMSGRSLLPLPPLPSSHPSLPLSPSLQPYSLSLSPYDICRGDAAAREQVALGGAEQPK